MIIVCKTKVKSITEARSDLLHFHDLFLCNLRPLVNSISSCN